MSQATHDIIAATVDEISAGWPAPSSGVTDIGRKLKRATLRLELSTACKIIAERGWPAPLDRAALLALGDLLVATHAAAWSMSPASRINPHNLSAWVAAARLLAAAREAPASRPAPADPSAPRSAQPTAGRGSSRPRPAASREDRNLA